MNEEECIHEYVDEARIASGGWPWHHSVGPVGDGNGVGHPGRRADRTARRGFGGGDDRDAETVDKQQ
ncbi:hypothetical protein ACIA59_28610 [Micromonospora haikouensis]|uniref:hypothetical protein n=1 Tax=Micromonospora haikouensis TaxID=686309 RepID=UPI0037A53419